MRTTRPIPLHHLDPAPSRWSALCSRARRRAASGLLLSAAPLLVAVALCPAAAAQLRRPEVRVEQVLDNVYVAVGFGHTCMVTTPEGNVIIDTSNPRDAAAHHELLKAVSDAPVRYVIPTHAHHDHIGGLRLWREPGTEVIAQREVVEFLHYTKRVSAYYHLRNGMPAVDPELVAGNEDAQVYATILFDETYRFELGGLTFEVLHTPGETPDHLTVWIPELAVAFVGDNLPSSFPNLYTLRGTKPRWALDYVRSLNTVLELGPELVVPSHGDPVRGREQVAARIEKCRDAILYVHDETLRGLGQGKDVFTLMEEIELPPELQLPEVYGTLPWSIRGIYDGYFGWFDGRMSSLYPLSPASRNADLVRIAGGPDPVAREAHALLQRGEHARALHLAEAALDVDPKHRSALETYRSACHELSEDSINFFERQWLKRAREETGARLARLKDGQGRGK